MINLSSRLITTGMIPPMLALALDAYVVMLAAVENAQFSIYAGIPAILMLAIL
jgi:hypothetical protein